MFLGTLPNINLEILFWKPQVLFVVEIYEHQSDHMLCVCVFPSWMDPPSVSRVFQGAKNAWSLTWDRCIPAQKKNCSGFLGWGGSLWMAEKCPRSVAWLELEIRIWAPKIPQPIVIPSCWVLTYLQENYNTPVKHTSGNPSRPLWKESPYSLLVKVARGVFRFGVLKHVETTLEYPTWEKRKIIGSKLPTGRRIC